mmetsp:Transcript_8947/g.18586  ORF Transcript_8947/g.18586 Transcript_8947/m.18586 type:complete len:128 (-) Transcript_8947:139-522(-)|eukprot:CAMPEP_0197280044 /NCGR_PEP_ID=MMETSP1432-20130617/20967_1 /TAXON_ID=44447 /ORGANISM="Pseudo-nitzschia delicatissima, Strain UNC1205" /LENGTH=127 /DNA_ID=CAMNT_0042746667 /DNA_START=33 /DNA_END=416 /DNA_ORIENTATION=-
MAQQSSTAASLRGRHYENKARAAQITMSSVPRPTVSNESLVRRLNSTRFQNVRHPSPSHYESPVRRTDVAPTQESNREMELVKGISDRLDTGLNEQALGAILNLLKRGEHPDAIVAVVTSLAQQQSR